MALIVLDASVVIAHVEVRDAHHASARKALLEHAGDDLRVPASAYSEALVAPAASGRLGEAVAAVRELGLHVEPIAETVAERAAELRATHRALRLPEALVLACGDVLDADSVVTADSSWRRYSKRVSVIG